jgi:CubicO group peptidase (beta-lactamase class C family)
MSSSCARVSLATKPACGYQGRVKARLLLLASCLLLAACAAPASTVSPANAPLGVSPERMARVRAAMQGFVDRREAAGFTWVVLKDGRRVDEGAIGMQDVAKSTPMKADTIFRIASMSKPITSVAVMILLEEGKLLLTDKLSKFIPAFKTMKVVAKGSDAPVAAEREITIRDLLTHRSGITYGFIDAGPVGDAYRSAGVTDGLSGGDVTIAENVARLATAPLVHQPGKAFQYGLSVDVLGRVIEVASAQPLDVFLRERIFKPLGMNDTGFSVPDDKWSRFATAYAPAEQGGLRPIKDPESFKNVVLSPDAYYREPKKLFSGGAGLVSTASDYARFCEMLLGLGEREGVRILGRKSVELMTVSHTNDLPSDDGRRFGLGVDVATDLGATQELGSSGSYGWGGLFGTRCMGVHDGRVSGARALTGDAAARRRRPLRASHGELAEAAEACS